MAKETQHTQILSKLVHGSNLRQKESHLTKYRDATSTTYLGEIREKYDEWSKANMELIGPCSVSTEHDQEILIKRIELLEQYKKFIDQQHYAEKFDSRSNLHSSVLEEFMYYLFKDLVAEFGEERRAFVAIDKVPKHMKQAIIAAEDERFYRHGGVDTLGILRAASANLLSGGAKEGASTITMQVARNFFLSIPRPDEKSCQLSASKSNRSLNWM